MRELGLHFFTSVGGGVGRSTLAVCTTKLLAIRGQRPVLLDLSFLGTSLADGLPLVAPVLDEHDWFAQGPTGRWRDLESTRWLVECRRAASRLCHVGKVLEFGEHTGFVEPFMMDDALEQGLRAGLRGDAFLWKDELGARYLPTSPARIDGLRMAEYLGRQGPHAVIRRLAWYIDSLVRSNLEITDVIIELPRGRLGLAEAGLWFAEVANRLPDFYPRWRDEIRCLVSVTVVTTPARNDWVPAVEHWKLLRERMADVRLLINMAPPPWDTKAGDTLAPIFAAAGDSRHITIEARRPESLGTLFVRGGIGVQDLETLASTLIWRPDAA